MDVSLCPFFLVDVSVVDPVPNRLHSVVVLEEDSLDSALDSIKQDISQSTKCQAVVIDGVKLVGLDSHNL